MARALLTATGAITLDCNNAAEFIIREGTLLSRAGQISTNYSVDFQRFDVSPA